VNPTPDSPAPQRVLFLCTGNSCRSQMAEGWARALAPHRLEACSAGIEAHGLNPLATRVMREAGVDISQQRSKTLDEVADLDFDLVVTVCDHAQEACPLYPAGTHRIHARFDDPPTLARHAASPDEALDVYRRIRDEIRDFVRQLADLPTPREGA